MEKIERSTINNNRILTAVMTRVIPLLNEAVDEIQRLQARVNALEEGGSDVAPEVSENGAAPAADDSVVEAFDEAVARPLLEGGYATVGDVESASDEDLLEVDGIGEARLDEIRAATRP